MTNESTAVDWAVVEGLLDEALALDPSAREAFLNGLAVGVQEHVRSWLGAIVDGTVSSDRTTSVEKVAPLVLDEVVRATDGLAEGDRIGAYRVVEVLGEGGMGRVLGAVRIRGDFQHRVAIKVLRREMASSSFAERFHRERDILARLDHPRIAKLLDGGETPDGLPYFVMEWIDGALPITDSCDARRLDVAARVKLLLEVCDAVQAAHQRLVIHRDLKSSNVLVDASGRLKLVDFGIAKPLAGEGADEETQIAMLTPLSASPEQMAGEVVGTPSDIYQLGLLLYELLSGIHPHRAGGDPDLRTTVIAGDFPVPSRVVTRAPDGQARATARGAAAIADLSRALRGDLDAIALRALAREPERRYTSAADLASDLRRWLAGEPVAARPDSLPYRLRKWTGRNPALAGTSVLAVLLLLAFAIVSFRSAVESRRQAEAVARERDLARESLELMTDLFESTSPVRNQDLAESVTAVDILDRGAERLRARFADTRPDLLASMLRTLAESNARLGRYEAASGQLAEALELQRLRLDGGAAEVETLLEWSALEGRFGSVELARERARAAAQVFQRLSEQDVPDVEEMRARVERNLAWAEILAADDPDPEHLQTLRRLTPQDATVNQLSQLARAYRKFDDLQQALTIYERQLEHPALGELRTADLGAIWNNLAFARTRTGDTDGAVTAYRRALELVVEQYGAGHPLALRVRSNLAAALERNGEAVASRTVLEEQVRATRDAFPDHWRLGSALSALSQLQLLTEQPDAALATAQEAFDVQSSALGADHAWTVTPTVLVALTHAISGNADSEQWLERALRGYAAHGLDGIPGRAEPVRRLIRIADLYGLTSVAGRLRSILDEPALPNTAPGPRSDTATSR